MWKTKSWSECVYLDKEKNLRVAPDIFSDSKHLPFRAKMFAAIYFDPPHLTGVHGNWHADPKGGYGAFYGVNVNQQDFWVYLFAVNKEFLRVLMDDGLFFLKWYDCGSAKDRYSLSKVLSVFNEFWTILKLDYVKSPLQSGKGVTSWSTLVKRCGSTFLE